MRAPIRRQRPVKGGRTPLPACVLQSIWTKVDDLAARYRVSRSWVIATLLADALGIKEQESYLSTRPLKLVRRK